jgi:hypothetical protein
MNKLLEKLDRVAGSWLNVMDEQLQQPIADTLSGEVFMTEIRPQRVAESQPVSTMLPPAVPAPKPAVKQPSHPPMVLKPSPKK